MIEFIIIGILGYLLLRDLRYRLISPFKDINITDILEDHIDKLDCDVIEFVEWCKENNVDYRTYIERIK